MPVHLSIASRGRAPRLVRSGIALLAGGLLLGGCAKQPPGQATNFAVSGKRLRVTVTFQDTLNPHYHYYFLINYDQSQGVAGNTNAPGPVAVLGPIPGANVGYGNGFATGSGGSALGFTDFVRFENNNYRLIHVHGDPTNTGNFVDEGQPISFVLPNGGNPKQLQFDIDLSQIVLDPSGSPLPAAADTIRQALKIKWLQINIVATDVVPTDPNTVVSRQIDSLGDTRSPAGQSSFLILDVSQQKSYTNQEFAGQAVFEPQGDVYVVGGANPDPALDIVDYTVSVVTQ